MKTEKIENEQKKKDLIVSDAFVTIKNRMLLAESYLEIREELSEHTPLYQILYDIENALEQVKPYYGELECIR